MQISSVGIVGGGAWGTALAQTLAIAGRDVVLWAYEPETVNEINDLHENRTYLQDVTLSPAIRATGKLAEAAQQDVVLLVPPAQNLRGVAAELATCFGDGRPAIICAKGIERATGKLMADVMAEALPQALPAILSGPSFAADVARGLPTAVTLACADEQLGRALAEGLGYRNLRIYWSSDVTGVQLGGAVKNVLAIAAGIVEGRRLGASAHAALIARGFAELRRLGAALGANTETLMGLSGLGDLILTCGSTQSRNMSLGRALGEGQTLDAILGQRRAVTEGVYTAEAVTRLAAANAVQMPICQAVHDIVTGSLTVDDAIEALLNRPMKSET